jgi:hypothetical protein
MEGHAPILDYALPHGPSRFERFLKACAIRLSIYVGLFVGLFLSPLPIGFWCFGHHRQWLVAVDSEGLILGPYVRPISFGIAPLIVANLLVVSLPVWAIWRFWPRSRV